MNHESRAALEARIRELEHAYQAVLQENVALLRELEQLKQPLPHPHGGSTAEKIQLFRSLFRGRDDVYAVRWVNAQTGKSGYAPALKTRGKRPPYEPTDLLPHGGSKALAGKQRVTCSLRTVCKALDKSRSDYKYTERYARMYSAFSIPVHPSAQQVRAMLGPAGNPTLGPSFNTTLAQVVGLLGDLATGTLGDIIGAFKHPSAPWARAHLHVIAVRFLSDAQSIVFPL